MEKFKLKRPYPTSADKQPIVRLKPSYYKTLSSLRAETGLPLGNIVEQCIDFALDHMTDEHEVAEESAESDE